MSAAALLPRAIRLACLAACLALPTAGAAAPRPSTLDQIRARGFVRCGSVPRPGLATADGQDRWSGLEVEICRAVATAVFGERARYVYRGYGSAKAFDGVRSGEDDLSFLTFAELADQHLTDTVLPGPPVFLESLDMMVAETSPARSYGDMAGRGICFMIGTPAENELEAWFQDHHLGFIPYAFQEEGEKFDTYAVQKCPGIVDEATALAQARRDRGVNDLSSRLVAGHLASYPVLATTPLADDPRWAAVVAWTISTLIAADARETDYRAGGVRAMTVAGAGLGLAAGWQKTVVERIGSYSAIFDRTLGAGSPLQLEPGLNRRVEDGGVLAAPSRD